MIKKKFKYLERLYTKLNFPKMELSKNLEGSSPPSIFIGRYNYPRVFAGPLVPLQHGNTQIFDLPEEWLSKLDRESIISLRLQLVRTKQSLRVSEKSKKLELLQEVALARNSVDVEAEFLKPPKGFSFSEYHQPFGPSGLIKNFSIATIKLDPKLEKAFYDFDAPANEILIELYQKGVRVSSLQRAFSAGCLGIERNRKLVPTRWSITAVDSIISDYLLNQVRNFEPIEEFRIYENEKLYNKFCILLVPSCWQYESMEAWFPGTVEPKLQIYSDWEGFWGRKDYAQIGGCYYAARLAIAEKLVEAQEQAGAIVLREIYPAYLPLGVWNVRENVREAMRKVPASFSSLEEALAYLRKRLRIRIEFWIKKSYLLRSLLTQRKLQEFS